MPAPTIAPTRSDSATTATQPLQAPNFDLSVRQLLAGAAAAVTAAILGSRLGVAGTLIGAALASSVTMITSAVYSHSLAAAQHRVRLARVRQEREDNAATVRIPLEHQAWGRAPGQARPAVPPSALPPQPVARERTVRPWAMAGFGALAACGLALLAITGIEAVRGTPLSGGDSGGLSVLGGRSGGSPDTATTAPAGSSNKPAQTSRSESGTESSTVSLNPSTTVTSTTTVTATDPATESSSSAPGASSTAPDSAAPTTPAAGQPTLTTTSATVTEDEPASAAP